MNNLTNFAQVIKSAPGILIAIIFGYNEQDIIVSTIFNALKQGMHVHYVDDYSTDGTRSVVQKYFANNPNVAYSIMDTKYRANKESDKSWNLRMQLQYKTKLARTVYAEYKWLLHMDADEVFECPWAKTITDGLEQIPTTVGKVNCEVWDYFPTQQDVKTWKFDETNLEAMFDITEVLTVYRKRNNSLSYFRFVRNNPSLDLDVGHLAKTEPNEIYQTNMIMHHFPYRSVELAEKKVNVDRIPRISANDVKTGTGWHYSLFNQMKLPIDYESANQTIMANDGRYQTYYLKKELRI